MVLVFHWVVLYEVQVRAIRQGSYVRVSVRPILSQICARLAVVDLGPVTGETRDVVWFENLLDAVYD